MNWVEIVHLRSTGGSVEQLSKEIEASLGTAGERDRTVAIYQRTALGTDLAIHIQGRGDSEQCRISALGLRLASALRVFGLVEHSLWREIK